jgi:hypothetical protein
MEKGSSGRSAVAWPWGAVLPFFACGPQVDAEKTHNKTAKIGFQVVRALAALSCCVRLSDFISRLSISFLISVVQKNVPVGVVVDIRTDGVKVLEFFFGKQRSPANADAFIHEPNLLSKKSI